MPVPGYFQAIRKVCDRYGILLVLDEIMCGMGRTGKMHAWEWEGTVQRTMLELTLGVVPDIQTVGKGLNGGYQALSAVLMQSHIVEGLRGGSGAFANGQTFQCHPAAAAAGIAVLSIFGSDDIVATAAKRGSEVRQSVAIREGANIHSYVKSCSRLSGIILKSAKSVDEACSCRSSLSKTAIRKVPSRRGCHWRRD